MTLTKVTFQSNGAAGGSGGSATRVAGDFTCFGAAGDGGLGGDKGLGGINVPLGSGSAPDGKAGNDGTGGSDGQCGAFSVGVGSDCYAAGAVCN